MANNDYRAGNSDYLKANPTWHVEDSSWKAMQIMKMIDVFEHVDDYLGFVKKAAEKADYKMFHIPLDMSAIFIILCGIQHWPL